MTWLNLPESTCPHRPQQQDTTRHNANEDSPEANRSSTKVNRSQYSNVLQMPNNGNGRIHLHHQAVITSLWHNQRVLAAKTFLSSAGICYYNGREKCPTCLVGVVSSASE